MYLFHFIDLLNRDFNCSNNLLSFSTDKVTKEHTIYNQLFQILLLLEN